MAAFRHRPCRNAATATRCCFSTIHCCSEAALVPSLEASLQPSSASATTTTITTTATTALKTTTTATAATATLSLSAKTHSSSVSTPSTSTSATMSTLTSSTNLLPNVTTTSRIKQNLSTDQREEDCRTLFLSHLSNPSGCDCLGALPWSCVLDWLMRKMAVHSQDSKPDVCFVPRFLVCSPTHRISVLSKILSELVLIDKESLLRFISAVESFSFKRQSSWEEFLLQKIKARLVGHGETLLSSPKLAAEENKVNCMSGEEEKEGKQEIEEKEAARRKRDIEDRDVENCVPLPKRTKGSRNEEEKGKLEKEAEREVKSVKEVTNRDRNGRDCSGGDDDDDDVDDVDDGGEPVTKRCKTSEADSENATDDPKISRWMSQSRDLTASDESTMSEVFNFLLSSPNEDVLPKPEVVTCLLQNVVLRQLRVAKSLSRGIQVSLSKVVDRHNLPSLHSVLLPWTAACDFGACHLIFTKRLIKEHLSSDSRLVFVQKFLEAITTANKGLLTEVQVELLRCLTEDSNLLNSILIGQLVTCLSQSAHPLSRSMKFSNFLLFFIGKCPQQVLLHRDALQSCVVCNRTFLKKKLSEAFEDALSALA